MDMGPTSDSDFSGGGGHFRGKYGKVSRQESRGGPRSAAVRRAAGPHVREPPAVEVVSA
jgi:hypothetical protein